MTNTNTPEQETFNIPSCNMIALNTKIEKMNRKAETIGCPPVSIEVICEYTQVHPMFADRLPICQADQLPQITMFEIAVHGAGPKIEGWKFVGTLDLNTLPGATIVKTVPDESVPQVYFSHDGSCDHCNKIRRRNDTFVLEGIDENAGQHQVVGRNCLKDFFGHDPSQIARFLTSLWKLMETMEDEERGFGGCSGKYNMSFDHKPVLAVTAAVINLEGWRAKSACIDGESIPTASLVLEVLLPPPSTDPERVREHYAWVDKLDINNERFVTEAANAIEWLEEQEANNEYMHNLHQIAAAEVVPINMIGFWCSLVAAYQRSQERLALQKVERETLLNEYRPEAIKTRIEDVVTLISIRSFDGMYGTCHIHRMVDSAGRTMVWFANKSPTMKEGNKYHITASIKKHDKYKEWKQTHVTRVRVQDK